MTSLTDRNSSETDRGDAPVLWRRVLRRLLRGVAVVLTAYTLVAQLLAIVPVSWTTPLLQWAPLQTGIIVISALRDVFGIWNVVIAAVAVVIFVLLRSPRKGHAWTGITLSTVGAAGAVATTAVLLAAVAPAGVRLLPVGDPFRSHATTATETVTLGSAGDVEIHGDLYLPTGAAPSSGWPVVVSIHGGGFTTGTRGPNLYTEFLPQHGYAVLDVDYRVASPTFHAWDTQVGDIGCALAWLGEKGSDHGVDADRITTYGESSGGNLAINSAYLANAGTLVSTCDAAAPIPKVKAVIGAYPAVNLTDLSDTSALARAVAENYVGGQPAQYPERYDYVDSATHVSEASPPTLVYTGTRDHLVFATGTLSFIETLAQRGVVHKFIEYPGMEHGTGSILGSNYATEASLNSALEWLDKYDK